MPQDTKSETVFSSPFSYLEQVQNSNRESGHHWFDPDTMRFFSTRICTELVKGVYFITSEKPPHSPRAYSIREVYNEDGHIRTVGETCQYTSLSDARHALKDIAGLKFLYNIPNPCTSWKSCDLIGHIAWILAKESDTFADLSDADQRELCESLMYDAKYLDRLNVEQCNTGLTDRQEEIRSGRTDAMLERVKVHGFGLTFNRDPRGNPLFITVPSGRTDDMGQRGITVPLQARYKL